MSTTEDLLKPYNPWLRWLLWMLLAVAFIFALKQLLPVIAWILNILTPFLIALVAAYVFHPIVNFVQRKLHLGRIGGILVVLLILLGSLVGLLVWLAPLLYHQIATMITGIRVTVPQLIERVLTNHIDPATLADWRTRLDAFLKDFDPTADGSMSAIGNKLAPVAKGGFQAASSFAGGVLSFFGGIGGFLATAGFALVASFYFLADMDLIPGVVRRLIPERHRERVWDLMIKSDRAVGGFLRGQLADCVCIAILTTIVLMLVGLGQYAVLIGCFAGLMNFIPYLGPIAGATPAIFWALATDSMGGWDERGIAILQIAGGFAIVQAIDGIILQPLIVGRQASLHPLAVMLALAVGAQAGIGGMIVAVPAACVLRILWIELVWNKTPEPPADEPYPRRREKKKIQTRVKRQETP